jgi:hypothetical protein
MWHSISAGVRAARKDLSINGKSHPQLPEDEDLDERIAAERESPGGYSDMDEDTRRWWQ